MFTVLNYFQLDLSALPASFRKLTEELLSQAALTAGDYPDAADPTVGVARR